MAHNRRFNVPGNFINEEKYDMEATAELDRLLRRASRFDYPADQIKGLIRRGANPHLLSRIPIGEHDQIMPLSIHGGRGDYEFLEELFQMGVEPTRGIIKSALNSSNPAHNFTRPAISAERAIRVIDAVLRNKPEIINTRGHNGMDENSTLLIYAIKKKAPIDVIRFLLENGADPNLQGQDGRTALMHATQRDSKIIQLLLDFGANDMLENEKGRIAHNYALAKKSKIMQKQLSKRKKKGGKRKSHHRMKQKASRRRVR